MLRHYLPSIAAAIALLIVVLIAPLSDRFNVGGRDGSLFSAQIATPTSTPVTASGPGNQCSDQTVGVSLVLNIDTKTPTEIDQDASASVPITANVVFDPPRLLRKTNISCCFGNHVFLLKGQKVLEEGWNGSLVRDYTQMDEGLNRGGILFDTYQNFTSNGAFNPFPATFIKYDIEKGVSNTIVSPSDDNTIDAGSVRDIMGGAYNDEGDGVEKITQKVKITFSGPGKIGLGDPNNPAFKDLTDGSITLDSSLGDDFSQHVFVCKDSQRNGICDIEECSTAVTPACSNGKDDDGDKKFDLDDPGCSGPDDTTETDNPPAPVNRTITLKRTVQPTLIVQPLLQSQETIAFVTTCANCTIQADPDPASFIAGTPEADAGFTILATLINTADQSVSHTIVVVGNAEQHTKLSTVDGAEYISLGNDTEAQFPASFLVNEENDYFVKARVDTFFEQVAVLPTPLPLAGGLAPKNGSIGFFFFQGDDSIGKKHVLVARGRYWDAATLTDVSLTPEPFHTYFQNRGDFNTCTLGLQSYPNIGSLFENPTGFQLFLDLLTLCQR